ncbi:hypothetical protein MML48_2g00001854 [Holotrichia oblita]|uniref:Uncharacterized protein n=1 Tax=Holotrichia oblita TaxID=644536 RepID=A0ACB9TN05_HOLOL|nr:hypothetical protein MML48_2g00001854 [Holotrichia oblita]
MMDIEFVQGQSDNLPKVDAFMLTKYFATNSEFTSAEIKGVKVSRSERESYGDNVIRYVQIKREESICTVKAKITPDYKHRNKAYSVTVVCDEANELIFFAQGEDCAAHLGGCKHAVAFLAWLHRMSEDPPSTSIKCYWKKSKLATIGTSLKFIKAKEMGGPPKSAQERNSNFLEKVIDYSMKIGHIDSQLTKYYKEFSPSERLSINYLIITMTNAKLASPLEFVKYCSTNML